MVFANHLQAKKSTETQRWQRIILNHSTPEKHKRYIDHVTVKVIPKVVSVQGDPSGY